MPIQQHPVPQQISSYEFRLIGEMTLKQFGWLAGGVLVALLFYGLPLAGFIKWPLALFSGFLGFAFAFLPIEERPLSTWLFAFIKAVFSPTLFTWQKKPQPPDFFLYQPKLIQEKNQNQLVVPEKEKLYKYLQTLELSQLTPFDQREQKFITSILNLFPKTTEFSTQTAVSFPSPSLKETSLQAKTPPSQTKTGQRPPSSRIRSFYSYAAKPPIEQFIYLERKKKEEEEKRLAKEAKTSKTLPIPNPPSVPNLIVGMVLGPEDEMIEGALIEICDSQGIPVRALKTNKLGQFRIATPLPNGSYTIYIEKEGYNFDIIKIETKGEIINPLEIRGQKIKET